MLKFLKLIHFDNILIVAFAQLCVRYSLYQPFGIDITLNSFGITLLILATCSIMAAGNMIIALYESNDYSELSFSESFINKWFIIFNAIGVLLGFYLANLIGRPGFAALFIITSGIFYLYASYLKEFLIIKNLVIAILAALPLLAIPIFDLLPVISDQNRVSQTVIFSIIWDYALFAFVIVWIREVIKDCLDVDIHHNQGIKTLPIILGKDRIVKIAGIFTLLPFGMVIYYIYTYFFNNIIAVVLILVGVVAPLLFFMLKCWNAASGKDFKMLSVLLKTILFITALSMIAYPFILV